MNNFNDLGLNNKSSRQFGMNYRNPILNNNKRKSTSLGNITYGNNNNDSSPGVMTPVLRNYFITLVVAYFITKIIYPSFYQMSSSISSNQEMINLGITVILGYVVYTLTGFGNMGPQWPFYLGIILGINYPAFYHKFLEPEEHSTVTSQNTQNILTSIIYFKIIILLIILLYTGVTTNPIQYLSYFAGMAFIILGLILSKKGFYFWQDRNQATGEPTSVWHRSAGQVIKFGISFASWLLAMLFIFPSSNSESPFLNFILQLSFGAVLGMFISNMSYQGPDYFLQDRPTGKCQDQEDCQKKFNLDVNMKNQDLQDSLVSLRWIVIFLILFNIAVFTLYFFQNR